ncbi:hypothetical protein F5Y16DRAFT_422889 [Xylariaceae sp. FL0255]|nr:hypothetical protein F5Y16DRAFT_422889 [Xylariaceae sp. FL0255]
MASISVTTATRTTAATGLETTESKSKPAHKIRKRAPKACLSCRARKVRCDVSQRGRPCMNCYLDSETCVEAHLYSAMPTFSTITQPVKWKKQNILKGLWWGCIVWHRILPLGMRHSIQISRAHLDIDVNSGLGYVDLADEVDRSRVYNAEMKRTLIEIFVQILDLCSILIDILTLVFYLDDIPGWAGLQEFQAQAMLSSARAALCRHEVLQSAVAFASPGGSLRRFSNTYENRHELVACTALPLVLHILDVKLSAQGDRNREAMKTYQPQYDGVDYISETIRHIINLAELDQPKKRNTGTTTAAGNVSDWKEMLASHPGFYLRLAMTMDISISKGRLAEESDFPVGLRGIFGVTGGPGRGATQSTSTPFFGGVATPQTPAATAFFSSNSMAVIQPGTIHSMSSDEESSASPASADAATPAAHTANDATSASILFPQSLDDASFGNEIFGPAGGMGLDHPYAHMLPALSADMLAATAYMLHAEGLEPAPTVYYDDSGKSHSSDHSYV